MRMACRTFYICHPKQALAGVGQPGGRLRAGDRTPRPDSPSPVNEQPPPPRPLSLVSEGSVRDCGVPLRTYIWCILACTHVACVHGGVVPPLYYPLASLTSVRLCLACIYLHSSKEILHSHRCPQNHEKSRAVRCTVRYISVYSPCPDPLCRGYSYTKLIRSYVRRNALGHKNKLREKNSEPNASYSSQHTRHSPAVGA